MSNLITGLVAIALIMMVLLTLTNASLASMTAITLSWDEMTGRTGDRQRTELELITSDIVGSGTDIDISLRNKGQTALREYSTWVVVIKYHSTASNLDPKIVQMAYTTSATPSNGQWTVRGIYLNSTTLESEVYEPNVFNPGEEMIVRLNVTPAIPTGTDNQVTLGVTNGVALAAPFSR